jgi:hypothetical protein
MLAAILANMTSNHRAMFNPCIQALLPRSPVAPSTFAGGAALDKFHTATADHTCVSLRAGSGQPSRIEEISNPILGPAHVQAAVGGE